MFTHYMHICGLYIKRIHFLPPQESIFTPLGVDNALLRMNASPVKQDIGRAKNMKLGYYKLTQKLYLYIKKIYKSLSRIIICLQL